MRDPRAIETAGIYLTAMLFDFVFNDVDPRDSIVTARRELVGIGLLFMAGLHSAPNTRAKLATACGERMG